MQEFPFQHAVPARHMKQNQLKYMERETDYLRFNEHIYVAVLEYASRRSEYCRPHLDNMFRHPIATQIFNEVFRSRQLYLNPCSFKFRGIGDAYPFLQELPEIRISRNGKVLLPGM